MEDVLAQLNRVRGIGGCLLLSSEGLPIASALRDGADEGKIAAGISAICDAGARLAARLDLGAASGFSSSSDQGGLLVLAAGKAWLGVLVDPAANLALVQIEARPFVARIAQRLSL